MDLPRVLGPVQAYCVVVGSVIGSGIFLVPASVAGNVPYMGGIVLVWIIGGLFSGAGALTLAELGAMMPRAGGPYVYLRAAYGPIPAFLFGWTELTVVRAGSMATLAAAFARYFVILVKPPPILNLHVWQGAAAVMAIAIVTVVNITGTRRGGALQVIGTVLKVGGVAALMFLPFFIRRGSLGNLEPILPDGAGQIALHRDHGRHGRRAVGVRRLDQRHAAGRGDSQPRSQRSPRLDPGHGHTHRGLRGDDSGLSLRLADDRGAQRRHDRGWQSEGGRRGLLPALAGQFTG